MTTDKDDPQARGSGDAVSAVRDRGHYRAIVCFVDDNQMLIQQLLALRESWLYVESLDTDLVVMGPGEALAHLPDDLVKIEQRPVVDDPVWGGYRYVNSIACLNGAGAERLDRYTHVLRSDVDTFITPAWNAFYPDVFTVGTGGYLNDDDTRQRIRQIAADYGLVHRGLENISSTWYGTTAVVRRAAAFSEMLTKHILTHSFAEDEGAWPGWFRGVATMYAGEIAVNHCAPDATRTDQIDVPSTSDASTVRYPHVHCWHTDNKFSKFWFAAGRYGPEDFENLDIAIIRDYCMEMAYRSLDGTPSGQRSARAQRAPDGNEIDQALGWSPAEPSELGSSLALLDEPTGTDRSSNRGTDLPLVSCLCPTFNRPPDCQYLIEEAIESFLRQDYPNKELIVLNDCAEQELVCDAPGVRVVNVAERFPTLGDKRNALVELARGDLLLSWDDDDVSLPWRLSLSVERLGDAGYFSPGRFWRWDFSGYHRDSSEPIGHNASIFRRSAFEAAGRYPSISVGEDTELHHALNSLPHCAAPNAGDNALTKNELFYIYRLGISPIHMSGGQGREVEYYRDLGNRPVQTGRFVLSPHWRTDYVDEIRRLQDTGAADSDALAGEAEQGQDVTDLSYDYPPSGSMPMSWDGKPAIWMAWPSSDPLPDLFALCLASVRRHNERDFEVILVTPENLHEYIDPHPAYELLSYVHRADYLRLTLLHEYGGAYLDMATIALRSLAGVYADLARYDIVTYDGRLWGEVFGVGAFGPTRPNSELTRAWSEALESHLDRRYDDLATHRARDPNEHGDCLGWSEILRDIVLPISQRFVEEGRFSVRLLNPTWGHFASGGPAAHELMDIRSPEPPDTELLILNHAVIGDELRRMSSAEILDSDLGICRLLQRALEQEKFRPH